MNNNIQMREIISAMKLDSKDVELFQHEVCVTKMLLNHYCPHCLPFLCIGWTDPSEFMHD